MSICFPFLHWLIIGLRVVVMSASWRRPSSKSSSQPQIREITTATPVHRIHWVHCLLQNKFKSFNTHAGVRCCTSKCMVTLLSICCCTRIALRNVDWHTWQQQSVWGVEGGARYDLAGLIFTVRILRNNFHPHKYHYQRKSRLHVRVFFVPKTKSFFLKFFQIKLQRV